MNWIKRRWRTFISNQFEKLDLLDRYQVGGHCGLCGKWVPDVITNKIWGWTLCEECTIV